MESSSQTKRPHSRSAAWITELLSARCGLDAMSTAIFATARGYKRATSPSLGGKRRADSSRVVERTSVFVSLPLEPVPRRSDAVAEDFEGSWRVRVSWAEVEVGIMRRV